MEEYLLAWIIVAIVIIVDIARWFNNKETRSTLKPDKYGEPIRKKDTK